MTKIQILKVIHFDSSNSNCPNYNFLPLCNKPVPLNPLFVIPPLTEYRQKYSSVATADQDQGYVANNCPNLDKPHCL